MTGKRNDEQDRHLELEQQAAANLLGWQKALADYQNLQKENEQKMTDFRKLLVAELIQELLPIFDNYQTALSHIPEAEKKSAWAVGLIHTLKLWENFLQSYQIEKISTVGRQFDPHLHEAVDHTEDESKADHEIISEQQSGYMNGTQIIRPAKVIINKIN